MAKKPRTPDPPRKVQAPKARHKHGGSDGGGLSMPGTNSLIGVGLIVIAGLLVGWFLVLSPRGSRADVTAADVRKVESAMAAAGCTFAARSGAASQNHMSSADQRVVYATFPAASGVHNPQPAAWGNYRLPADPRQVVHNLEHGGIAVWYGPRITTADRGRLDAFYDDDPNGVLVTPLKDPYPNVVYPKHERLGSKIALSVWTTNSKTGKGTTYVAICPSYDEKAFTAFRDAFRGKGPERYPVSEMRPGT